MYFIYDVIPNEIVLLRLRTAMKANQCCATGAHRRYFRQCKNKYFRLSHSIRRFTAGRAGPAGREPPYRVT